MFLLMQNRSHKNFTNHAKLIFASTISCKELSDIKQTISNNGFSNHIVDQQIKLFLRTANQSYLKSQKTPLNYFSTNRFTPIT